jgi:hypothetical protein
VPASRTTDTTFLEAASAMGVAAGLLSVGGGSLYLDDGVSRNYPTALSLSDGFYVLGAMLVCAGFASALVGFRSAPGVPRRRVLGLAGNCFSASGAAFVGAYVIRAVEYANHHVPSGFTAATVVEAVSSLALVAAGASVAVAFLSARHGREPDNGLTSAGTALALFFSLGVASTVQGVIAYSDYFAPGGVVSGLIVEAVGDAFAGVGAVVAALAFQRPARNVLLALAATVLGVGFLVFAIGATVYAVADSSAGADGKTVAADWLSAVSWLGLAAAATCAAFGFRARRAAQPS